MEELQRNIDEVFRESLGDYREAPPPAAWSQVSRRLDEEDRRRRGAFLRWPWIMLSLLMVVGCAWIVVGLSLHGQVPETELPATAATGMAMPAATTERLTQGGPAASLADLPDDEDSKDILTHNTESKQQDTRSSNKSKKHIPFSQNAINTANTAQTVTEKEKSGKNPSDAPASGADVATRPAITNPSPAGSVAQGTPDAITPAIRHKDALRPLPHARRMKLFAAKHGTLKAPAMLRRDKADFPALSVAKAQREEVLRPAAHTVASAARMEKKATTEKTIAVAPQQPAQVWQKPAVQRIGRLAITKKKVPLAHEKLNKPGTLQPAPALVTAAVLPAPKDAPQQQQGGAERLAAKPQSVHQQAEPAPVPVPAASKGGTIRVTYPDPPPVFAAAPAAQQLLPQATLAAATANSSGNADTAATSAAIKDALQEPGKPRVKPPFSLAVLGGYEQKMQSGAQAQFSLAARLSWQLSSSVSVGVQPTFRYSQLPSRTVGKDAAYQRSAWRIDSFRTVDISPTIAGKTDEIYNYVIHQIYDSIVIRSRSIGGAFWEVELPVMVRCRLTNSWSVWGGPSVVFGSKLSYTGDGAPQVYFTERKDSIAQSVQKPKEEFLNYFGTSSLPEYSTYKPSDDAEQASMMRLGYMAGIGYNRNRWLMEASLHGQLTGYRNLAQSVQDVYAHPNVLVSIGYLLFSAKKATPAVR